jgi:hypothetical protein
MFVVIGGVTGAALGIGGSALAGATIGAGAGALVGGTLKSGKEGAKAAEEGAALQAQSADQAAQIQWDMYQQTRADQMPWLQAGKRALGTLEKDIAAGPGEFRPEEQPGYKFGFQEFVEKPYMAAQSAKGKRLSGETYKGLTRYAQDYANTAYDNFLQRYYQRLQPQQSMAGVGQTTAAQLGAAGRQTGVATGEIAMAKGQAQAEGLINAQGAKTQSYQNLLNTAGTVGGWFF